jgi:hypothetical protein
MASFVPALRTLIRPAARRIATKPLLVAPRATFVSSARLYKPALTFLGKEQPRLRIGTEAPNFTAQTTHGEINFHECVSHGAGGCN